MKSMHVSCYTHTHNTQNINANTQNPTHTCDTYYILCTLGRSGIGCARPRFAATVQFHITLIPGFQGRPWSQIPPHQQNANWASSRAVCVSVCVVYRSVRLAPHISSRHRHRAVATVEETGSGMCPDRYEGHMRRIGGVGESVAGWAVRGVGMDDC